jgi:predicted nucleic acid-binding protein
MIILDTNVISALMRPDDNPAPILWLDRQGRTELWTTSISVMEIRYEILRMAPGKRRQRVLEAFTRLGGTMLREKNPALRSGGGRTSCGGFC